jgi:hypothetical protein
LQKCIDYLGEKALGDCEVATEFLEKIFLPIHRGFLILHKRFFRETSATQIVAVSSFVKPRDRAKFLAHLCLFEGRFVTEFDLYSRGSMKQAFVTAGLLPSVDSIDVNHVLNILHN